MSTLEILLYGQIGASIMMFFAWMHAIWIKNTSYVDVLWAYGVGILGFIFLTFEEQSCDPARLALLKALILTWSVRLGTYLLKDASVNRRMHGMHICAIGWGKMQILASLSSFKFRLSG